MSDDEMQKARFGIDVSTDMSTQEITRLFDITREKLREIEKRARDKRNSDDNPDDAA